MIVYQDKFIHLKIMSYVLVFSFSYLIIGNISSYLAYAILCLNILFLLQLNKHKYVIISVLASIVLASRIEPSLDFFDDMRVISLIIVILYELFKLIVRAKNYKLNKKSLLFIPFFICGLISTMNGAIVIPALMRLISFGLLIFFVFYYVKEQYIKNPNETTQSLEAFFLIVLISSFFIGLFIPSIGYGLTRLKGVFGNANGLGLFLIPCSFFTLIYFKKLKYKWILTLFILICLIKCGSRNSLLAILGFGIYYLIAKRSIFLSNLSILGLITTVAFLFTNPNIIYKFVNLIGLGSALRLKNESNLLEAGGRAWSWKKAITMIPENIYFGGGGYGYDTYIFVKTLPKNVSLPVGFYGVWNSTLSLLLDFGVIGTIAFYLFLFTLIFSSKLKIYRTPLFVALMLSGIAESWMASSLNAITPFVFIILMTLIFINENELN